MIYKLLIRPGLFRLEPEDAHVKVIHQLARWRVGARVCESFLRVDDTRLRVEAFGLKFPNPVGLAAGLDKHGEASAAWQRLGFGFFEIGTVTPRAQPGNERPRIFRLPEDQALINRLGFNSVGAEKVRSNLACAPRHIIPMGVNVGRNSDTPNEGAVADYLSAMERLHAFARYFVLNVSSPNTKGLRELQRPEKVRRLVEASVNQVRVSSGALGAPATPVLVKVAPDFEGDDLEETIDAALAGGAAGIIATNTTVSREGLSSKNNHQQGGLSGAPLRERAKYVLRRIFRHTEGSVPIIGVGGIFSAQDAYERICSGATLVQVYTGLVYEGPCLVRNINRGLVRLLARNGLSNVSEAVGRDC